MDLTQLANVGEFIGGVAVLVTLIYLVIQLQRARSELARRNGRELVRDNNAILLKLPENPRLMEIHLKAQTDYDSLPAVDRYAWAVWLTTWIGQWEQGLLDALEGDFIGVDLDRYAEGLALTLRSPGGAQVWEGLKQFYRNEAVELLDRKIGQSSLTTPELLHLTESA